MPAKQALSLSRLLGFRPQTEESYSNFMPGTAILTSGKNLVKLDGLLFLCPEEISRAWDTELQS